MSTPCKNGSGQNGVVFDLTTLSPDTADRVLQHMDQEGERMCKTVVSLTRAATVGIHALSVRSHVAQLTEQAMQLAPQSSADLREIEELTHQQICDILGRNRRY